MNNLFIFNITADICGLALSLVGITAMLIWRKFLDKAFNLSLFIFITNFIYLLSNFAGLLLNGNNGLAVDVILRITNFFKFLSGYTLAFLFTVFLFYFLKTKGVKIKRRSWLYIGYAVEVVLLIISQFNNMFYYIDSANVYRRGDLFFVSQLFGLALTAIDLLIIVYYRKQLNRYETVAFMVYTVFPIVALILQMFFLRSLHTFAHHHNRRDCNAYNAFVYTGKALL